MNRRDSDPTGGPAGPGAPQVFAAPWHAQAFAMAVTLNENGAFSWKNWSEALGEELKTGRHEDSEDGYYSAWLTVLENILCDIAVTDTFELAERKSAWDRAARNTPHGEPITLTSG